MSKAHFYKIIIYIYIYIHTYTVCAESHITHENMVSLFSCFDQKVSQVQCFEFGNVPWTFTMCLFVKDFAEVEMPS